MPDSQQQETETRELAAWKSLALRLARSVPHDHSESTASINWSSDGTVKRSGNPEGNCPRCRLDREIASMPAASLPTGGGGKPESVCLRCGTVGDGVGPAHACGGSTSHPGEVASLRECIEAFERLPGIEGHAEGMEQTLDEVHRVLRRHDVECEPVLAATVERLVIERDQARAAASSTGDGLADYRAAWMRRGRELNDIYEALALEIVSAATYTIERDELVAIVDRITCARCGAAPLQPCAGRVRDGGYREFHAVRQAALARSEGER